MIMKEFNLFKEFLIIYTFIRLVREHVFGFLNYKTWYSQVNLN